MTSTLDLTNSAANSGIRSMCSRIYPPIDCEILALNEAQSPKFIEHRDKRWRNAWNGGQAPNAIGPPRLLRHRSERPCDTRAHKRDKLAPPHRFPRAETLFVPCRLAFFRAASRSRLQLQRCTHSGKLADAGA